MEKAGELLRKKGIAKSASMMSLAVVPAGSAPRRTTRTLSGTRTRTSSVNHALAMSVLPTPKAKQPRNPLSLAIRWLRIIWFMLAMMAVSSCHSHRPSQPSTA